MTKSLSDSRPIFIAEIEQFGGAERSLLALSSWLDGQNLPHYFLTYIDHCGLSRYADHPLNLVELRPGPGPVRKVAALRRHFRARGESPWRPLMSGYQPALHGALAGLRGFHDLMHDTPSLFLDRSLSLPRRFRMAVSNVIVGIGLRGGGKTIVTSEFLKAECWRDFRVRAEIARMGGLGDAGERRIRPVTDRLNMLSVCRIEGNKRLDWVFRSLGALEQDPIPLSSRVDWRLDIAGQGPLMPALEGLAATLGIAHRVRFHGFVSDEDLVGLYDAAHLFLMPAIQGYGIPAIESLARGIPVLLHRESGVSDLLLATAWATVLYGDETRMGTAMREAIVKVMEGRHHGESPPPLPTESGWAEQVAGLCGWLSPVTLRDSPGKTPPEAL